MAKTQETETRGIVLQAVNIYCHDNYYITNGQDLRDRDPRLKTPRNRDSRHRELTPTAETNPEKASSRHLLREPSLPAGGPFPSVSSFWLTNVPGRDPRD